MKSFAAEYHFKITSPLYPQAKGLIKSTIKMAKKILQLSYLSILLIMCQANPAETGYSLSQLMLNCQIHIKVPGLNLESRVIKQRDVESHNSYWYECMKKQFCQKHGACELIKLSPGHKVIVEYLDKHETVIQKHNEPRLYNDKWEESAKLRQNRKNTLSCISSPKYRDR